MEQLNNPDGIRIGSAYTEAVLAGGIGVGKSTVAVLSLAYQIYVLSCLQSPQRLFNLSERSEIVFVVQAPTERLAKVVGYSRMRELGLQSPYFKRFAPDKRVKSELRFPNGVVLRPLSGSDTAALGQNVLGGLLDEVAFAGFTERSTRIRDREVFDQAVRGMAASTTQSLCAANHGFLTTGDCLDYSVSSLRRSIQKTSLRERFDKRSPMKPSISISYASGM